MKKNIHLVIYTIMAVMTFGTLSVLHAIDNNKLDIKAQNDINRQSPGDMDYNVGTKIRNALFAGKPFKSTVVFTTTTCRTAQVIVDDSEVSAGAEVYITDIMLKVNGSTTWTAYPMGSLANIIISDHASTPLVTISSHGFTANALNGFYSSSFTLNSQVTLQSGTTNQVGISAVANSSASAGSDMYLTVQGFIY